MNIFYHISPTTITEDFVAKIYEASSPLAEIGTQSIPAPHTSPISVTFTGLDKVTHIVRLIGVTSAKLYHEYDVEPTEDVVTIFDNIRFKIGDGGANTPVAGTNFYTNSLLSGLTIDDFNIFRNGYGFMYPGTQYTLSGDTVTLATTDVFGEEEEFLITRKPNAVTTVVNDSVVGKQFGGNDTITDIFLDVVSTVNYDPSHLRHLIRLAGASANYVFPTGAAIPIGYIFRVTNFGPYVSPADKGKVTFSNAPLLWGSTPKTSLDIPFTGTFEFVFDGTNWNCTIYSGTVTSALPQIVYAKSTILGVVSNTNAYQYYQFDIPDQSGTDYRVIGSIVGLSADANTDNYLTWVVTQKMTNYFKIKIRKLATYPASLQFDFIIVK